MQDKDNKDNIENEADLAGENDVKASDGPQDVEARETEANTQEIGDSAEESENGSENTEIVPAKTSEAVDTGEGGEVQEEEEPVIQYVPKLTEKQQKIWQTVLGFVCGFAIWFSLAISSTDEENGLLKWLFLIIFVAVMVIRNQIEKKTGVILKTFMKFFLISLIIFLGVFVIYAFATGKF